MNETTHISNSAVPWISAVPKHCKITKIKRLSTNKIKSFVDGDWIESPYITDSGIRLLQTGNIGIGEYKDKGFRYISEDTFVELDCTEVFPGNVLISRLAEPAGRACLAPSLKTRMVSSVDVTILDVKDDFFPKYVVYFLSNYYYLDWIKALSRGGTRDRISREMLGNIQIIIPPKTEQIKISNFLEKEVYKINTSITNYENIISFLKKKEQSVINKAITRGIESEPTQNSQIEWIGDIPKHWKISKFLEILTKKEKRNDDKIERKMLEVSQYLGIIEKEHESENLIKTKEETLRYFVVEKNDLVVNVMWLQFRGLGVSFIDGIVSPDYHVYSVNTKIVNPKFLNYLVRSNVYLNEYPKHLRGIRPNSARITKYDILRLPLILPSKKEQEKICMYLDDEIKKIKDLINKSELILKKLRELKITLISSYVIDNKKLGGFA